MNPNQPTIESPEFQAAEFVFREATTPDELAEIFRFRYQVLRNSRISGLCQNSHLEIDFDEFEPQSHHFGVYHVDGANEILVGCERGVFNHETPIAQAARIAGYNSGLNWQAFEDYPSTSLPGLQCLPDADIIEQFCDDVWTRGGEVCESTRFGIVEEYRSPELSRLIVEATIATYLLAKGIDLGIAIVSTHHKPFYYRYGFRQIPGTSDAYVPQADSEGACLALSKEQIPSVRLPRLESLADQYLRNGYIRFQANIPVSKRSESLSHAA